MASLPAYGSPEWWALVYAWRKELTGVGKKTYHARKAAERTGQQKKQMPEGVRKAAKGVPRRSR